MAMASQGPLFAEYRIVLPFLALDKAEIGLLYTLCIFGLAETGGGEGVTYIETNETPDEKIGIPGRYYKRVLDLESKMSAELRMLAPRGQMEIIKESWIDFPKIYSLYMNPAYMKQAASVQIHTLFVEDDKGNQDNVFKLEGRKLNRKVYHIDIVNDPIFESDYKEDTDPSKVRFDKINRGPLRADWKDTEDKFLTVYMFLEIEYISWGLQNRIQMVLDRIFRRITLNFYRTLICKLDDWYELTMEDIRALEEKTQEDLEQALKTGEPVGTFIR